MLYIFAGFPGKGLGPGEHIHSGGLRYAIEHIEFGEGVLEEDPLIHYRKRGVFIAGTDEFLHPLEYRISERCQQEGITWDWFHDYWFFGNGVTMHKTLASPEYQTVVHGTDLTLNEFLAQRGVTRLSEIELERKQIHVESWQKYEACWLPNSCPQENHLVHLTWLVTTHRLPEFVYERIRDLVERGAEPKELGGYSKEPGKHFHMTRTYFGG